MMNTFETWVRKALDTFRGDNSMSTVRRVQVEVLADPRNRTIFLEGDGRLPENKVYIDPQSGRTFDGSRGDTLSQVTPGALEIPRTIWYREA